jgi:hypothetical protein
LNYREPARDALETLARAVENEVAATTTRGFDTRSRRRARSRHRRATTTTRARSVSGSEHPREGRILGVDASDDAREV